MTKRKSFQQRRSFLLLLQTCIIPRLLFNRVHLLPQILVHFYLEMSELNFGRNNSNLSPYLLPPSHPLRSLPKSPLEDPSPVKLALEILERVIDILPLQIMVENSGLPSRNLKNLQKSQARISRVPRKLFNPLLKS